jgi:hypothetical protein
VQFARRFDRELTAYYQAPLRSLSAGLVHACLADAFNYHGWGKLTVDLADLGHGFLTVTVANAALPALVTEADRPVDLLMAGLLAAVFAHLAGADLDAVQTECPSMGAEAERFVVGPAARIKEIEQWLATAAPHAAVPHAAVVERLRAAAAAAPEEAE